MQKIRQCIVPQILDTTRPKLTDYPTRLLSVGPRRLTVGLRDSLVEHSHRHSGGLSFWFAGTEARHARDA
jgi:hypothetical protein